MRAVTVIGSGNAFNTGGRAHACYLLQSGSGEHLLLDCGATSLMQLQAQKAPLDSIHTILLTHFHGDHFAGLPFLLLEYDLVRRREAPLAIAGPPGTEEACRRLMDICYPDYHDRLRFALHYREFDGEQQLGSFQVRAFPIHHRPESQGYRITGPSGRSFAFSGDTAFDEALHTLVDGVDLAIIELSMFQQTDPPTAHVTLAEVREGHGQLKAKRVVWSHIYDELALAVRHEGLGETATDGLRIEL